MYKSKLQELCHQKGWVLPEYTAVKDGPDHCPRFTTTVTVNGVSFESPQNQCKSSKEAQNVAAKLAFDYFSASNSNSNSQAVASPSSLSPGFVASSCGVDVRPAKNQNLRQKHERNVQNSLANETFSTHKDENRPKGLLHLYKNRLQHYTQKKNLTLPEYSYEFEGPPHVRVFRASVMIEGRTYRSPEYYSTLKDAEHAAAKVALESLSLAEVLEDEGLYKTLLQELAQKEGFHFPSYSTTKTGPAHMPTFVSTVEVGGETYQGRECKTKKQSEMNAAKVAYNGLTERPRINNLSPGCTSNENIEVPSLSLQPIISDNCKPNMGAVTSTEARVEIAAGEIGQMDGKSNGLSPGSESKEPLELSSPSLDSIVACDLHKNILAKPIPTDLDAEAKGKSTKEETNAKRYRCSSPTENMHDHWPETSPPTSALPNAPSSCIMPTAFVKSDAAKPAEGSTTPGTKVLVYPHGSTMATPEGATILSRSDDKWVAMRVEMNPNQQR